jgi:GT2 family glycosyltransferase
MPVPVKQTGPRVLVAVVTCRAFRERAESQRKTWLPQVDFADVRFFVGRGKARDDARDGEVELDVPDGYDHLPHKVKAVCAWAVEQGYDYIFKIDDDVYVDAERLAQAVPTEGQDYVGRLRGPSGGFPAPYASGFSYWLSKEAASYVARARVNDVAEDRWIGNVMQAAGFKCVPDYRYVVAYSDKNCLSGKEGPRSGNQTITVAELRASQMEYEHEHRRDPAQHVAIERPEGDFSDVCVVIKTFLRDGHMYRTVGEVEQFMPSAKIVIVDDGVESKRKVKLYADLRNRGHVAAWLPFDSGFCAKSNEAVRHCDRPLVLIASDDFTFNAETSRSVARMKEVLEHDPSIGVASGRMDGNAYDGTIEWDKENGVIREVPLQEFQWSKTPGGVEYQLCDITVNWSLVRREVFNNDAVKWDERYKIGGDHFEFFEQVGRAGWKVAVLKDAPVRQRRSDPGMQANDYGRYRSRAKQALPLFFQKYGLKKYIAFDGRADVLQRDGTVASVAPPGRRVEPLRKGGRMVIAKERLYMSYSGQVVGKDSRDRKSLLAPKGGKIPYELALKAGLVED